MWMMEPAAHEDHMNISYTNNGSRKLRPLVPRPPPPTSSSYSFHLNNHLGEQNKREFINSQQMVVVSSRWNPTPEQLQTLEELYRRGTRTPSADEIQHITAQLRLYGKIEGKNVFYWFQNHKARERQKRRRQLDNPLHQPPFFTTDDIHQSVQRKDSEFEETRNWAIPTFSEVRERTRKAEPTRMTSAVAVDQRRIFVEQQQQEEEEEEEDGNDQLLLLHRRRKSFPATWNHMMGSSPPTNHISSTCSPTTFSFKTSSSLVVRHEHYETLELFPVNSNREQPEKCFLQTNHDVNLNPRQFIEFLPLKK